MSSENHGALDSQQLLSIIERIEHLNEDMASIAADIKEIYSEAKSAGYDPKYIRECITEEAEAYWFYEDLQHLLKLTPKKMSFSS